MHIRIHKKISNDQSPWFWTICTSNNTKIRGALDSSDLFESAAAEAYSVFQTITGSKGYPHCPECAYVGNFVDMINEVFYCYTDQVYYLRKSIGVVKLTNSIDIVSADKLAEKLKLCNITPQQTKNKVSASSKVLEI